MTKIIALLALPVGLGLLLDSFKIISLKSYASFDFALIGAIFLIALQVVEFILQRISQSEVSITGLFVPLLLALPGALYLLTFFLGLNIAVDQQLLIGAVLFTEGVYALH